MAEMSLMVINNRIGRGERHREIRIWFVNSLFPSYHACDIESTGLQFCLLASLLFVGMNATTLRVSPHAKCHEREV
ncbi:hypothetical protein H5410_032462 [Solanum commersonii]|uniref:Uncharacterized protein n=1 Tax=Solanum commersonii TaxID=4109 RepID=A0A9J5YPQ3_SOLCO|nr:hypothetical protein H5410_032462 [Solanum commersonii]